MSASQPHSPTWNPWKFATIGMALVFATALITGVVVANYVGNQAATKAEPSTQEQPLAPEQAAPPRPASPPTPHDDHAAEAPRAAAPPAPVPERHVRSRPSSADIEDCNRYATSAASGKASKTVGDALLGGALGAGLGAAGGAIAGGGGGAGKGAGIGALVGVAGGTLYGLNQANQTDARAAQAYRVCMKRRGYAE